MHSFLVGTNTFPAESADYYHNFGKLDELIDPSHDNVEQRSIIKQIQDKSAPYTMRGGGTICWVIDEHSDKISEWHSDYKLSSLKKAGGKL